MPIRELTHRRARQCSATTRSATTALLVTTSAYQQLLAQANVLLDSDARTLERVCNFGVAPFNASCSGWATSDQHILDQVLALLNRAQVPPADIADEGNLRRGLQHLRADDSALISAITTANHKAETAAYNTIINDPCTLVAPALLTMDPASHLVGC